MSNILRFGIPSLDALFGGEENRNDRLKRKGIFLPNGISARGSKSSVSICISGPDGTGKSVLGLHLASRYLADCRNDLESGQALPKVLYISTDLKIEMAKKVWSNFGLDWPNKRETPFAEREEVQPENFKIELHPCKPLGEIREEREVGVLAHQLTTDDPTSNIKFIDLASYTAGDDWGFINRMLSVLKEPDPEEPRHLMVLDSVEGFEVLSGEHDAFGEAQPRRSRIAQIMRSAGNKCHILFIIEEPEEGKHLPEEFVTDAVIRLRSVLVRDYARRTIELEKVRGHSHVRGQHVYLIRSGTGSTTGRQPNPDEPILPLDLTSPINGQQHPPYQSYLHVCHSIHHLSRDVMTLKGKGRPAELEKRYAAFGIRHLDDMLEGGDPGFGRRDGNDGRGLRCSTTTALIGNSETQKSPLGYAFLCRCFREYAGRFRQKLENLRNEGLSEQEIDEQLKNAETEAWEWWGKTGRHKRKPRTNNERLAEIFYRLKEIGALADDKGSYAEKGDQSFQLVAKRVRLASWQLGTPVYPSDGVPVLLTTMDIHAEELAFQFLPWLLRKVPELKQWDKEPEYHGCIAALRLHLEEFTICRRLEIHDLPASVFFHIVKSAIETAQSILHEGNVPKTTEERFDKSWGIRVVIDDFSILKNTYIEIRDEPLWLRFLVFYLGREGVTTLLIDTQPGQPDTAVSNLLDNELRSLVHNHLYTWRFSFYGENRVAIAPIPPISPDRPTVIREIRFAPESAKHMGIDVTPLIVDPHFELYAGIERGTPQPIPLQIRLFAETENFKVYIEDGNIHFLERFVPLPGEADEQGGKILVSVPSTQYDKLREFTYLQRDTRLDHTLIFQVDEFWYLRRPTIRRAGAFHSQVDYLNGVVSYTMGEDEKEQGKDKWTHDWAVDAFDLFQQIENQEAMEKDQQSPPPASQRPRISSSPKHHRRWQEFEPRGYRFKIEQNKDHQDDGYIPESESVDRVPFMWDFGFLLCKKKQWENCAKAELTIWNKSHPDQTMSLEEVWQGLPKALKNNAPIKPRPSWRQFLEASCLVARAESYRLATPVPAIDLHAIAAQSFSCLVLEIWVSEIYQRQRQDNSEEGLKRRGKFASTISERQWDFGRPLEGLVQWLGTEEYQKDLFKTWLLLVESLDLTALAQVVRNNDLSYKECNPHAVAVRHWYKTACRTTEHMSPDDPLVPVGLPGNFSTRGDWFLAVAGGSRSIRLADKALDILNSRRSNYTRLKLGLGLPIRNIEKSVQQGLHTGLITVDRGHDLPPIPSSATLRLAKVPYNNLLALGADRERRHDDFHWLWRSSLKQYYRHARIWQEWLARQILRWERLRYLERDTWVNGFERYDLIAKDGSGLFALDQQHKARREERLAAWEIFQTSCEELRNDLMEASRP